MRPGLPLFGRGKEGEAALTKNKTKPSTIKLNKYESKQHS